MRIAIIYDEPEHTPQEQHWLWRSGRAARQGVGGFRDESEFGRLAQVESIARVLTAAGHEALAVAPRGPGELFRFLEREAPGVVFNCCEGFCGESALEMNVAAAFELFRIPYTGSPATALAIALDKAMAKALLSANGVATPRYAVVDLDDALPSGAVPFPAIVKPLREDASIGIDAHSVVGDEAALRRRVRFVQEEFRQPALVEEYVEGRELNVALLATDGASLAPLPISEITFDGLPPGAPRIVSYEAKWVKDSRWYRGTVPRCPAVVDAALADRANALALRAAAALGVRDYARVDLRVRASDGAPFVLEVNPNPDLSEDAGFARAAAVSGSDYEATISAIVRCAIERADPVRPRKVG